MTISQKLMDRRYGKGKGKAPSMSTYEEDLAYGKGVGLENLNATSESEQKLINAKLAQKAAFSKSGNAADLLPQEGTEVKPDFAGGLSSLGSSVTQQADGTEAPLLDATGMALSGAGAGLMLGGPAGAAIGAGVGAGVGLFGGLAKARIAKKQREAQARKEMYEGIAKIEQQRGMLQGNALANIMATLRGTFGGL